MAGYKNLDVYNSGFALLSKIHRMSLELPSFEKYEEGSQIRRSSKSICANIVEGYALRKHKNEYLHYLYRAYGSCEETIFHLEALYSTGSMTDKTMFDKLLADYHTLSAKIFTFIQAVEHSHQPPHYLKKS